MTTLSASYIVKVTPKAKKDRVLEERRDDGTRVLKVYVNVAPEDGKANKAVIEMLAKHFSVAKSSVTITHGLTSRDKVVRVEGARF